MKTWNYIDLSDNVGGGITKEGFGFVEIDIDGWNDDESFTDLEKIVSVRGTIRDDLNQVQMSLHFDCEPEIINNNVTIQIKIREVTEIVKKEIESFLIQI